MNPLEDSCLNGCTLIYQEEMPELVIKSNLDFKSAGEETERIDRTQTTA